MLKNFLIIFFGVIFNLLMFRTFLPQMISSESDIMVWVGMIITLFVTAGQIFFFALYFNRSR